MDGQGDEQQNQGFPSICLAELTYVLRLGRGTAWMCTTAVPACAARVVHSFAVVPNLRNSSSIFIIEIIPNHVLE